MKALVTGATGFTGRALATRLLADGLQVTCPVRRPEACADLAALGAEVVAADLRDRDALFAAARGAGVVYHVAALYRSAGLPDSAYREVNVDGTRHLLEAAVAAGVARFVHCSTIGVHGHVAHPPPTRPPPSRRGTSTSARSSRRSCSPSRSRARGSSRSRSCARPASTAPGTCASSRCSR